MATPPAEKVRQFPCKQCGANLTFAPGTTHLTCPYCGYVEEVPVTPEAASTRPQPRSVPQVALTVDGEPWALLPTLLESGPADDVYRIRAYETTYSVPRFNNAGTQTTVLILQNPAAYPISGNIYFWSTSGALVALGMGLPSFCHW